MTMLNTAENYCKTLGPNWICFMLRLFSQKTAPPSLHFWKISWAVFWGLLWTNQRKDVDSERQTKRQTESINIRLSVSFELDQRKGCSSAALRSLYVPLTGAADLDVKQAAKSELKAELKKNDTGRKTSVSQPENYKCQMDGWWSCQSTEWQMKPWPYRLTDCTLRPMKGSVGVINTKTESISSVDTSNRST